MYKEYTEAKRGTSWKQKLKQTIDRCVITAKKEARVIDTMKANVDDFLSPTAAQDCDKKRNSELE